MNMGLGSSGRENDYEREDLSSEVLCGKNHLYGYHHYQQLLHE
jgi:hypothetical protein